MMEGETKPQTARHPGAELEDVLSLVGMTRKELSLRVGVTEKYIGSVIDGTRDISFAFARRLEHALAIPARKWLELQMRFDEFVFEQKERGGFHPDEAEIVLRLAGAIPYLKECKLIGDAADDMGAILELRNFLGVSDLRSVPKITYSVVYRAQFCGIGTVDPYMLLAWKQACERLTASAQTAPTLSVQKLKDSVPAVKHLMFYAEEELPFHIGKALASCGIAFRLVRPFDGVPARGYMRRQSDGRALLCLPARRERQDAFWLTLFREISQIMNGNQNFVDFFQEGGDGACADECAEELLIPAARYRRFTETGDFSFDTVCRFAESQIVPEHILLARLVRDGFMEETEEVRARLPEYAWENI